jgi:catechol 2,3-dioxygenase-like lactoylglutathione lyase family enzyme
MTTPIRVKALDHVTIVVKDLEQSRKFYVEALGMEQVPRPGFSFDGRWFQAGDTQIHLILEHEQSGPAGLPEEVGRSSRAHHFAFLVEDAHRAEERLEELGYEFVSRTKARPDGAAQVFVLDPDGHIVELCSPPRSA